MTILNYNFESGSISSDWEQTTNFNIFSSPSRDNYSAGSDTEGNIIDAILAPSELSGGKQINSFEYYWRETDVQDGFLSQFVDSSGDVILEIGGDNPQWNLNDGDGSLVDNGALYGGDGYDRWIRFKVTFDWNNGEYTYEFEDTQSTHIETGTRSLIKNTNVEKFKINGNKWGDPDHIWFDDFTILLSPLMITTLNYDFESSTLQGWIEDNGSGFSIVSSPSRGSYAAGCSGSSKPKNIAHLSPSRLSGGKQISYVEFYYYENSNSNGGGLQLEDNSGNPVIGVATNNPEWDIYDNNGWNQVYDGNSGGSELYDEWHYIKVTFDWNSGTCDVYWEQTSSGYSDTFNNRPLINNTNVETLRIKNQNNKAWINSNYFYMWFDDFTISLLSLLSVKKSGSFGKYPVNVKIGGSFVEKPVLVRVSGSFV